jgi:hypothetical protein
MLIAARISRITRGARQKQRIAHNGAAIIEKSDIRK